MLCHVVDVDGSNRAGLRWYELRDANDGNWSIHQQGTYSPDNGNRFMASIAMDSYGNIGLGYSHTDVANNLFPGLRYTGRYANDPLGQMTVPEEVAQAGGDFQTGLNRYGDYGHMSLDPNGSTFWFTGEYLNASGSPRTRIFSFDLQATVGISDNPTPTGAGLTSRLDDHTLNLVLTGAPLDGPFQLDLIGMDGRILRSQRIAASGGQWSGTMDLTGLAPAVYFARVGDAGFQRVQRIVLAQ